MSEKKSVQPAVDGRLERHALSAGIDLDSCKRIKLEHLEKFAILIASEERESCAKVCDEMSDKTVIGKTEHYPGEYTDEGISYSECADAIRKRHNIKA